MGSLFDRDEEERKKRAGAPVETITPTVMTPTRVGGPAPVKTLTPTVMAPPQGKLLYDSVPGNNPEGSLWDTLKSYGDKAGEVIGKGFNYMTESPEEFKERWISEQMENIHPSERVSADQEALAKKAEEEWKQRKMNRMLIGGALGAGVGAMKGYGERKASKNASSVNKATYGGQLGTGYRRGGK